MTPAEWTAKLNGREYHSELDRDEERQAEVDGVVIVYGASDDLMEFRGAINDEANCYDGGDIYVTPIGPIEPHDCDCRYCGYKSAKKSARLIKAVWDRDGISWQYKTDIPHETFDIMEDGELYCRGIVFYASELEKKHP